MNKLACKPQSAFTLIELLVVMAIIGILAAILLPALKYARIQAQIQTSRLEMANILNGINKYEMDFNRFPVANPAVSAALTAGDDFTFGTYGITPGSPSTLASTGQQVLDPSAYQTNNCEVVGILLDLENFGNGVKTANFGHVKNTSHVQFIGASFRSDNTSPGIGNDGVFRDPWGNPYIITVDLNNDGNARDAFYRLPAVSQDPNNPTRGLNGLTPKTLSTGVTFEAHTPVMIWSAGPDKMIDPTVPANKGVNKDNVLSWK